GNDVHAGVRQGAITPKTDIARIEPPLVAAFLQRQLPVQALIEAKSVVGAELHAGGTAAVAVLLVGVGVIEAVVFLAGQRQADVAIGGREAVREVPVVDAAFAAHVLHASAQTVAGRAGDDADHAHQGIGAVAHGIGATKDLDALDRSEEHTSELQSRENLVCRLLL